MERDKARGMRFEGARLDAGFESAAALARHLGISRATVSSWERGKSIPHGDTLEALTEVVQKPADWLLYGSEEKVKAQKDVRDRINILLDRTAPDIHQLIEAVLEKMAHIP